MWRTQSEGDLCFTSQFEIFLYPYCTDWRGHPMRELQFRSCWFSSSRKEVHRASVNFFSPLPIFSRSVSKASATFYVSWNLMPLLEFIKSDSGELLSNRVTFQSFGKSFDQLINSISYLCLVRHGFQKRLVCSAQDFNPECSSCMYPGEKCNRRSGIGIFAAV